MSGLRIPAEPARPWREAALAFFGRAWIWWALVLVWMGVIFVLSSQPRFAFVPLAWQSEVMSVAAHAAEYFILALLLWMAVARVPRLREWAVVAVLVIGCLYAVSDELHQYFVPGRVTDVRDLLVDAGSVVLGVWFMRRYRGRDGRAPKGPG